jgi:esterase/lipase
MAEAVKTKPDTIVLIHGFWVTPRSWEHWKKYYEAKGYTVLTPAYPGFGRRRRTKHPSPHGASI